MRALLVLKTSERMSPVHAALAAQGWAVCEVERGAGALRLAGSSEPDLIVLYLSLSDGDGIEDLADLRTIASNTPIIVLSDDVGLELKVRSLQVGADDYVQAPVHEGEFLARIQALVRRSRGHSGSVIQNGPISLDLSRRTVSVDGSDVFLTEKEFAILELLSLRMGETVTKDAFLSHLYGDEDQPHFKIIDVYVAKLRKKLAAGCGVVSYIETVWGKGYSLRRATEKLAA